MNAVEIEQAITDLAEQPFDRAEFPYAFLEAFGNKETTIKRLRAGASNKSDLGGVLQTSNIHILTCDAGQVPQALAALKASPATAKSKAKFILATDGTDFEAEDLTSGETVACAFKDFPDHFGFFLPLAGISTVRQISENAFDIRATSRLNRLYVELLKDNPEWGTAERRHDMNKLMARLIFCFFAEDTDIFVGKGRFTETVAQMSARDSSNTHEVLATLFRAMNTKREDRAAAKIPRWAEDFPYVNGQLFSGGDEVPRFSKIARSYLLHVGGLDWTKINPDIFGSMIQAVAEDEERGELGMHYTSVPNILKVLNPLFLDDLRAKLEEAGDNPRTLLNLRKRMARIRVFDPACGSGNFLVIAYKEMRAIEAEINKRRGESDRASELPLTNFRGIELRDFPAEIARLALVIAEYQCDVLYRGQKLALAEFLPLRNENWITCGNALRLDWLSICPPTGTGVKFQADDLFGTPVDQAQIDFQNEGGETFICGNPPYVGDKFQTDKQKADLKSVIGGRSSHKAMDYIAGWFWKASEYITGEGSFAFVSTNSICQGVQVPIIWPPIFSRGQEIFFAHKDFYWSNNASRNANVICIVVGVSKQSGRPKYIYAENQKQTVAAINAYLIAGKNIIVEKHPSPISDLPPMVAGNIPRDKGNFMLSPEERDRLLESHPEASPLIKKILGSMEFINGIERSCLWIEDDQADLAQSIPAIKTRLDAVIEYRRSGSERGKLGLATPHRFERTIVGNSTQIIVPRVSSERRPYIPVGLLSSDIIISDAAQAIYDAPIYVLSIICSQIHLAWVSITAGRMKSDFRYSSGVCYNSFPIPLLTEKNKADLTRCAEDILLAREHHFPATIADLYDPENMPADLRAAHDRNDEVLERIYIGRRFKNDTERLEKLFDLYTKMTASAAPAKGKKRKAGASA
ncbi:class I SAM-dependent DNA methyltransferase [Pseudomonas aeruginosa]|nr:class I SAM-dependent DNA methyltransferase [Pseudomonas aeruginosa]MCU7254163.1 class I SAM-dependent DNA methyltransferase [Pseudomonas aeruginosa]HCE5851640.1 class I SAM-dependent DNA methyltransferase [Pseudomonas aeruginosa]HCE6100005.1 class I SAM-dependent DNA methyltransferase [Pseudomonas aeruginosa]HCJ3649335.1 class I SAM-dependent DNA methyltransferase [Pseudomonas aeruginosa]